MTAVITDRVVVASRAVAMAAITLAVSAGAHALGGGHHLSAPLAVVLGALLLAAAVPLARRPLSGAVLSGWTLGGQAATHVVLTWAHPTSAVDLQVAGHHGAQTATSAGGPAPALTPMLVAHAVGTVLAVTLLVAIERSAAALRRRFTRLAAAPALPPLVRLAVPPARAVRPTALALVGPPLRGPPLAA